MAEAFTALIHEVDSIPKDFTWILLKFLANSLSSYRRNWSCGSWLKIDIKLRDKFLLGCAINIPILFQHIY